ncbi:methyltransferase family protein [Gramella sp. Hel_I_59]|uniref:class I SAM-dependent methyltransferase n=1 Tax=Gramella sp. Hel_I_59 TaxID=1249978 RepID=UPI001171F4F4|nr:class I SAM-dependent methyltransferase [Gramella sp. Hel_I_59]TQI69996.1 methyltransferase family protein [Gramella sp. Hel_I_59]
MKSKKPWPTKEAMEQVYAMNLWGKGESAFYSGNGSHNEVLVQPYIEVVRNFLKAHHNKLSVCDLGCGDFNIGMQLLEYAKHYIAVDIVPALINYNKTHFKFDQLEFRCLNIAADELPKGDVVILRQVLQHLSNPEVQSVLNKIKAFKYLILTEHQPASDFIPNKDIISGQGIRLKKNSGLEITKLPFNFKFKTREELLSIPDPDGKGVIKTILYRIQ